MKLGDYPEWQNAISEILDRGGVVMLVGATDTGKTTFCSLLANAALAAGKSAAIVDADIGQSEIGPPTCIGWALPDGPFGGMHELQPSGLAFVGSTSPRGVMLEMVVGLQRMADAARAQQTDLVLVDTTGFVRPPTGVRLKQAKCSLLRPDHIVAIQRRSECEPILTPLAHMNTVKIHRLPVPGAICVKTSVLRAQRRASRFARYFQGAREHRYVLDEVILTGTWLNDSSPVAPHLLKFISISLGTRAYYAERQEGRLCVVTSGPITAENGVGAVQQEFRVQELVITPASIIKHVVVGLADGNDRLLGVGLVEEIDFRRGEIAVVSPLRAPAAVRLIHFGLLRVKPDGTEVGVNRPAAL